jgi:Putative zinc- or iron-chelating domain
MVSGTCSRCGECCRWLPIALVRQCKPHQLHYLRERGLTEAEGYFLADAPCRHLKPEEADGSGTPRWGCAIYETRPATCRDFCGKTLSGGKRYYVPACCTMSGGRGGETGSRAQGGD